MRYLSYNYLLGMKKINHITFEARGPKVGRNEQRYRKKKEISSNGILIQSFQLEKKDIFVRQSFHVFIR